MESLVEDVALVMAALQSHGATGDLVNANVVFARLEDYSAKVPQCNGKALVDKVITSFLIDLGMAPPLSDSPDLEIVDVVESKASASSVATTSALPSSSVVASDSNSTASSSSSQPKGPAATAACSKQLSQESNLEAWTLSPGLCQAFNEPYSPLVTNPSSPEEVTEAKESITMESTSQPNSTSAMTNTASTGAIPKVIKSVPSSKNAIIPPSPSKRESDVLEPLESNQSAKKYKSSPKSPTLKTESSSKLEVSDKNLPHTQTLIRNPANTASKSSKAVSYVATLSEMFPEADPQYVWDKAELIESDNALGTLIESMLSTDNYPRVFRGTKSNRNVSAAAGSAADLDNEVSNVPSTSIKLEPAGSYADNRAIPSTSKASGPENKPITTVSSLSEAKLRMDLESGSLNAESETPVPAREPWQDQLDIFVQIFPDADPSFLEDRARELFDKEDMLRQFVADLLERREYPSRKDWQWRQEQLALQKKYTEEFSIPNFLEIIPDPFTYFADAKRKCSNPNQASMYLRNKYRKLRVADISSTFSRNGFNLALTCKALDNWTGATLKSRRTQVDYDITKSSAKGKEIDVPFLQEIAFLENETRIVEYLDAKKKRREDAFNEAKAKGELLQCQCCYDDEVLLEDVRNCSEGHIFCLSCLQKSSEQRIGDGLTSFPCLEDCTAEFSLQMLQEILKPTVFSRLVQRKQAEEVKAAGIEDLVQCPFCDFCNIPPREDKVFRCLNPDCMKESCRLCKEISHVPLRCDEVEKKSEVEMRTYIENKMTEALVRTCWKCNRKFVKEDGCNKMTCQCGAMMCYVCRQPVKDYSHFNGQGGDNFERCPLFQNNNDLHLLDVVKAAEAAKQEALARNPAARLVHDPTQGLPEAPAVPRDQEFDDYDEDYDDEFYDEEDYFSDVYVEEEDYFSDEDGEEEDDVQWINRVVQDAGLPEDDARRVRERLLEVQRRLPPAAPRAAPAPVLLAVPRADPVRPAARPAAPAAAPRAGAARPAAAPRGGAARRAARPAAAPRGGAARPAAAPRGGAARPAAAPRGGAARPAARPAAAPRGGAAAPRGGAARHAAAPRGGAAAPRGGAARPAAAPRGGAARPAAAPRGGAAAAPRAALRAGPGAVRPAAPAAARHVRFQLDPA